MLGEETEREGEGERVTVSVTTQTLVWGITIKKEKTCFRPLNRSISNRTLRTYDPLPYRLGPIEDLRGIHIYFLYIFFFLFLFFFEKKNDWVGWNGIKYLFLEIRGVGRRLRERVCASERVCAVVSIKK